MKPDRSDILHQLQREILALGGMPVPTKENELPDALSFLKEHFPHGTLPTGAMHEFMGSTPEDGAATLGFIAALMSSCLPSSGAVAWISNESTIHPPSLSHYRLSPHHVLFIHPARENDLLWVTEEALKCSGLRAVIAELKDLPSKQSRRLQLAVEKSGVTGFVLNRDNKFQNANHCVSRWTVRATPSESENGLPGMGMPKWEVELLKIRNGRPGRWMMAWTGQELRTIMMEQALPGLPQDHKLTG
jgi:protein ImuA